MAVMLEESPKTCPATSDTRTMRLNSNGTSTHALMGMAMPM
jgi:hypothetical protein